MSGLVDIWTSEKAKLKSKGQAVISAPPSREADEKSAAATSVWRQSTGLARVFQVMKLPSFQCSEASLSMLVDTFSA